MIQFNWVERFIFPPTYGILIYFIIRLITDVFDGSKFWLRPWQLNAIEISTAVVTSYIMIFTIRHMLRKNLYSISHNKQKVSSIKEYAEVIGYMEIIVLVTLLPMAALTDDGAQLLDIVLICLIPPLFILLYYTISKGNALVYINYERQLQIEKINADQLQTELQLLKAQYHPHFLFNALNTVYFQIDDTNQQAKHTLEKLSELLRYQLYDQYEIVPIKQELDYLQSYIALQKIRMNESLKLHLQLPKELNRQSIYPLLLLPLVENAFKYVGGSYRIQVIAAIEGNRLVFDVINSIPANIPKKKSSGIGLENLRRRLALLYPGRHELIIEKQVQTFKATLSVIL
ncbi:histidine kinase [Olivibacter sp. SDN3]|uniref:sensor histidine kinase n=1 Tax=Olivibacter sp. SDN3 TaxID=2764720 RepID=UPI0016512CAF|nr:histidine kinase [Olivibacter sp. SDN3]QNL49036.1 histidine kinase [Olivibacter sp. SDN3]